MSGCTNFVPNLWKPQLCSNCLQPHSFASAPPSPVLSAPSGRIVGRSCPSASSSPQQEALHKSSPTHPLPFQYNKQQQQQQKQPTFKHHQEHKRSLSTPVSSPSSSPSPSPRAPLHVLTRSDSAKRKKTAASDTGACESFKPQRWRPTICMHCFEPLTLHTNNPLTRGENYLNSIAHMDIASPKDDGNGEDDTTLATQTPLPETPRVPPTQDMDDTLHKLNTLTFSSPPRNKTPPPMSLQVPTTPKEPPKATITPRSALMRPATAPSPTRVFDEDDPFRDFEDLTDTTFDFKTLSNLQGFDKASSDSNAPFGPLRTLRSSRGREQFFDKYKDNDEDDSDGGVDMDVEHFVAMAEYSYVNNKIMEIASVKQEAERSQAAFQDNPTVVTALFEILTAKQQQIQKALAREKINAQDHSKLLERLNAVKDMLKPNQSATW